MNIAIIGGGAAGMMAAATLVEMYPHTHKVFLIERNSLLGNKVLISGGGRCNVTTGIHDKQILLKKYPRGAQFLRSAFYDFPPEAVYEWFEDHGVPLKIEKDMRVFPKSNDGKDVVGVFQNIFKSRDAHVLFRRKVEAISKSKEKFTITFLEHPPLEVDRVIIATGGQAFRHTGSMGDGYTFAEMLGHSTTPLAPSLSSFLAEGDFFPSLAGISFQRAGFELKGKDKYAFEGPFIFTHKGVSGPAIFALSSMSAFEAYSKLAPMFLHIDFLVDKPHEQVEEELFAYQREHHKRSLFSLLREYLPEALAEVYLKHTAMDGMKILAEVPKKGIRELGLLLKRFPLSIVGRGEGEEFVTAGGVDIHEVDKNTMESKICPGLFFAGEVMNVDGFTGGFNLQASWATGRLAGKSAGR